MAVYQEKDKSKWTKDGRSWYFRCYYTDMYGNRKQKVSKMYSRKKDAEEEERTFLSKVSTDGIISNSVMFVDVYNSWLSTKKTQVKSSTYYSRRNRAELYILPYFEKYKLHSIKINILEMWKMEVFKSNIGLDHKNRVIADLKEILDFACCNYDFDIKVASKLQKVKTEKVVNQMDSETNFWTYEEFKQFISVVDDRYYYIVFNFFYYTGLRIGEICALNWNDINFERKTLRVNKTLSNKVDDQLYIITSPKTNNSIRFVDLDDNLVKLLKEHKDSEKQLYGFNSSMFVFGNVKPLAPTTFKRYLYKYIEIANVKRITPHGFRHSHVSLLINLGCDSRDVANRIGDTVTMIEKTYYHMFPTKKTHVINVLNQLNQYKK